MVSSGKLRCVAPVPTDVSEELSASFIRVTRIGSRGPSYCVPFPSSLDAETITPFPGSLSTHSTFPFPLCILNSEFHSSFLSHLVFLRSVRRLLLTASVFPSSPIHVTLMKEALSSSETSVLTRARRRNILEDTTILSHRKENLKSYTLSPITFQARPHVYAL
jgi:hypothetical protein